MCLRERGMGALRYLDTRTAFGTASQYVRCGLPLAYTHVVIFRHDVHKKRQKEGGCDRFLQEQEHLVELGGARDVLLGHAQSHRPHAGTHLYDAGSPARAWCCPWRSRRTPCRRGYGKRKTVSEKGLDRNRIKCYPYQLVFLFETAASMPSTAFSALGWREAQDFRLLIADWKSAI